MREQVQVGHMVFVADGEMGVGGVREVRGDEIVINIQNAGDFVLPMTAIRDVHDGKVVLDLKRLEAPVVEALRHVHDAELPEFAVLDPRDGTPEGAARPH